MIEKVPKVTIKEKNSIFSFFGDLKFQKVLNYCTDNYLYWDKVKYHSAPYNPKEVWVALSLNRQFNSNSVALGKYNFRYTVTASMQKYLHLFDMQMGGTLPISAIPNTADRQYYLISSLMEEAIASSQMEGASTTRKVAKEMLRKQENPKDKSQRMILNNYQTIRYLVEHKDDQLTPELLLNVHQMITAGTLDSPEEETKFRTSDDIVVANGVNGEIAHVPPKARDLPELISRLCFLFNEEYSLERQKVFVHPVVKAIIIHFLVAWLHPFSDGNGRTARSLVYWFLLKQGYRFMEYLSISRIIYRTKAQYEKAFLYTENDNNDIGYFLHYNIEVLRKAADELRAYLERKSQQRHYVSLFVQQGLNQRQAQFMVRLDQNPDDVITVKEYATLYGVANQTARSDLYELVKKDRLQEIPLNKRKVGFMLKN
ncbi:MAG: Fic family protein [Spirochaetia bacterium]|nr:Fic family protein [Spirochaetia bacterium]